MNQATGGPQCWRIESQDPSFYIWFVAMIPASPSRVWPRKGSGKCLAEAATGLSSRSRIFSSFSSVMSLRKWTITDRATGLFSFGCADPVFAAMSFHHLSKKANFCSFQNECSGHGGFSPRTDPPRQLYQRNLIAAFTFVSAAPQPAGVDRCHPVPSMLSGRMIWGAALASAFSMVL